MKASSTRLLTGVMIAPPAPCRRGAKKKWFTEVDSAKPIEPIMKTATARLNTMRAPKRSAVQPLAGMNTASDNRYEVMASFSVSGLVPISAAIAGSEVAITVESMFSMNRAVATMSGIRRSFFMEIREGTAESRTGCITPLPQRPLRNPGNHLNLRDNIPAWCRRRRSDDDLPPRRSAAAARAAPERAALFGDFQSGPDRILHAFRTGFSRPLAGAVGACGDRRPYEAGRAPAPGGGGADPPARPAAGLPALTSDLRHRPL